MTGALLCIDRWPVLESLPSVAWSWHFSCRVWPSAWSLLSLEVIGLRAADPHQKDLGVAAGLVSSKTVQWSRHTLLSSTFFWWETDMGCQILIQNCLMRWSDNGNKVCGGHGFIPLVLMASCSRGATIILIYQKRDWGMVDFCTLPKARPRHHCVRDRAGSWTRTVLPQELLTETRVLLSTNGVG